MTLSLGANIAASKLVAKRHIGTNFDLAIGSTVANREEVVFVATRACTVDNFFAKLATAATTGTTSFDLKKNGSTILTGTVDLTSSEGTTATAGTLSGSPTLAAGDYLSIQLSNSSGDGLGGYAYCEVSEDGT